MEETQKIRKISYAIIFGAIVFAVTLGAMLYRIPGKYNLIVFAYCASIAVFAGAFFWYMQKDSLKSAGLKEFFSKNRYYFILIATLLVVYIPIMTDGFYYYDEFWNFPGHFADNLSIVIPMSRAYHGLLIDSFSYVYPAISYILRWFTVLFVIIYGIILLKWMSEKSGKPVLSFFVTVALCIFSVIADCVTYASTISFAPGIAAASMSVILFERAYASFSVKKFKPGFLLIAVSATCLVLAFQLYQIATAAVFVLLLVYIYFSKEKKSCFKFFLLFMIFFGIVTLFNYYFSSHITQMYGLETNQRGSFINGAGIYPKIVWFLLGIVPMALGRLEIAFFGRMITNDKSYLGVFHYIQPQSAKILMVVMAALILLALVMYIIRRKNVLNLVLMILSVPFSYFVFLVLQENGYMTYYAMPLISCLLFLLLMGVVELVKIISTGISKIRKKACAAPINVVLICLIVLLGFQTNLYLRQYWVGTNQLAYNTIKNGITIDVLQKKNIHVYGVLTTGQANIYSEFAVRMALHEMNIDADTEGYKITVSDNNDYISTIENSVFQQMSTKLTEEQIKTFLEYYILEPTYMQYHLNTDLFSTDSEVLKTQLADLHDVFVSSDMIPENFDDTIIIDLRWTNSKW